MYSQAHDRVQMWMPEAVGQNAQRTFNGLVSVIHGNEAVRALTELCVQVQRMGDRKAHRVGRLPVPHPLDYDWRFTAASRMLLLEMIERMALGARGEVVLFGAPTLFEAARATAMAGRCTLVDACPATVSALKGCGDGRVYGVDILRGEVPDLSATVVVADPPWYEEFAQAFLWASARIVELGGTVLLTTPPLGTRPGIEQECRRVVAFAKDLGLELRGMDQCLRYDSPPFEKNAMRAAGQSHVAEDWRFGTLTRFKKVDVSNRTRPNVVSRGSEWVERSAFGVRLRMRRKPSPSTRNPRLVTITEGDVLDSVSRRDPRREHVDVWTSGNRVFACGDTETFIWIVEAIEAGRPSDAYVEAALARQLAAVEQEAVIQTTEQASAVISCELEEYVLAWEG